MYSEHMGFNGFFRKETDKFASKPLNTFWTEYQKIIL